MLWWIPWERKQFMKLQDYWDCPADWQPEILLLTCLLNLQRLILLCDTTIKSGSLQTVVTTHMLIGATGWARYCFSDPRKSKQALNSYISHSPQSLNAMVLNKAFMRVFYDIAMNPTYAPHFRLLGQIHDSIPFFYHQDHLYLPDMVKERMEIPVTIKDIAGVERTFTVPAALKIGIVNSEGELVRAKYWRKRSNI